MADKKISALTGATTPLAGTEVLPIVQGGSTVKVSVDNLTAGKNVSAAKLSVNTTSTASKVIVGRSGAGHGIDHGVLFVDQANNNLAVVSIEGYSTNDLQLLSGSGIRLYTNSNLANSGLVAQIDNSGNTTLNTGNLVIGTAGKGIDFSANTHAAGMTSELLNDYEEGTWTPTGNGITYAAGTAGKYTKIGNLVICTFNVVFPTTADASNAQIQGLPFTSGSTSAPTFGNYSSGFNGFLASGNTFMGLVNTTGTAFIVNSTLSTQTLIGSITYQV